MSSPEFDDDEYKKKKKRQQASRILTHVARPNGVRVVNAKLRRGARFYVLQAACRPKIQQSPDDVWLQRPFVPPAPAHTATGLNRPTRRVRMMHSVLQPLEAEAKLGGST